MVSSLEALIHFFNNFRNRFVGKAWNPEFSKSWLSYRSSWNLVSSTSSSSILSMTPKASYRECVSMNASPFGRGRRPTGKRRQTSLHSLARASNHPQRLPSQWDLTRVRSRSLLQIKIKWFQASTMSKIRAFRTSIWARVRARTSHFSRVCCQSSHKESRTYLWMNRRPSNRNRLPSNRCRETRLNRMCAEALIHLIKEEARRDISRFQNWSQDP